MADLPTLKTRLVEAELALHRVATGKAVELVTEDGSTVRYNRANQEKLELYVRELTTQIASIEAPSRRRGPVQFCF